MSRRIHTARPASDELAAAVRWYEGRRAGLGAEFYEAIIRTMDRIAELPEVGSAFRQLKARRLLVAGFPYQIVYRVDSDDIRIIAIAHLKRRPLHAVVRSPSGRGAGRPTRCVQCDDGPYHSNRP